MIVVPGNLNKGLTISHWLQIEKGLVYKKEFTWYCRSDRHEIVITCEDESMESFIALKWA